MRAHEILGYIDLDRISIDLLRQLQDVFDRELKRPVDLDALEAQYGQPAAELELQQARANVIKTKAETDKIRSVAAANSSNI